MMFFVGPWVVGLYVRGLGGERSRVDEWVMERIGSG